MNWSVAITVAAVVGILGSVAAVLWWRLANKQAPYRDSAGSKPRDRDNVVIIRDEDTR
jgi:hypothetical protein